MAARALPEATRTPPTTEPLPPGPSPLTSDQAIPTDRHTFAQVLVDSRTAGPPVTGEHVWVKDGRGMVQTHLVGPGFRESFEWGIRPGWEATGLWHAVDRYAGTCGGSRMGRRAAAFNHASSCRYGGGTFAGTLTSPSFTVSCSSNPQSLYFWHWSQTERLAEYDTRKVSLSINGGPFFTVWQGNGIDTGAPDTWKQQRIGLEDFCNQQVRVQFAFDTVDDAQNEFAGWYIDDLEVR